MAVRLGTNKWQYKETPLKSDDLNDTFEAVDNEAYIAFIMAGGASSETDGVIARSTSWEVVETSWNEDKLDYSLLTQTPDTIIMTTLSPTDNRSAVVMYKGTDGKGYVDKIDIISKTVENILSNATFVDPPDTGYSDVVKYVWKIDENTYGTMALYTLRDGDYAYVKYYAEKRNISDDTVIDTKTETVSSLNIGAYSWVKSLAFVQVYIYPIDGTIVTSMYSGGASADLPVDFKIIQINTDLTYAIKYSRNSGSHEAHAPLQVAKYNLTNSTNFYIIQSWYNSGANGKWYLNVFWWDENWTFHNTEQMLTISDWSRKLTYSFAFGIPFACLNGNIWICTRDHNWTNYDSPANSGAFEIRHFLHANTDEITSAAGDTTSNNYINAITYDPVTEDISEQYAHTFTNNTDANNLWNSGNYKYVSRFSTAITPTSIVEVDGNTIYFSYGGDNAVITKYIPDTQNKACKILSDTIEFTNPVNAIKEAYRNILTRYTTPTTSTQYVEPPYWEEQKGWLPDNFEVKIFVQYLPEGGTEWITTNEHDLNDWISFDPPASKIRLGYSFYNLPFGTNYRPSKVAFLYVEG